MSSPKVFHEFHPIVGLLITIIFKLLYIFLEAEFASLDLKYTN